MLDLNEVNNRHIQRVNALEVEISSVYSTLVLPNWGGALHGFPETLYGFMMAVFARFDLMSAYWKGDASSRGQTIRMTEFLNTFVRQEPEANSLAVQVWRHKLMHTSEPRFLMNDSTGKVYRWLLHWHEHLPLEQHFTFVETLDSKILNIGLMYLIEDLKLAVRQYLTLLAASGDLQQKYERVEIELNSYKFRA
jgi:hypothetical protein